jgi:hypothetical protein
VLRLFEKLEKLYTRDCPRLQSIFPSECNLGYLKILKIENSNNDNNCISGEALFPMSIAQSLQQLKVLSIKGCGGLKHVIGSESCPSHSHFHSMMPRLKKVQLNECSKLKFVFPICCVEGLVQLQKIEIRWCDEVEYVFGECDDKDHSSNQNVMLPNLQSLSLGTLGSLIGICPEKYHLKWPSLENLELWYCPKLTTTWIAMMIGFHHRHHQHTNQVSILGFEFFSRVYQVRTLHKFCKG